MKINIHDVHEVRECGYNVVKCILTLSIDSTFTIPEIMRRKMILEREIIERIYSLLTVYLSKPIEIDEESLNNQTDNSPD